MGLQFFSFKQAELFLGEQSHQSFVSGPASPASQPQLNPKKVKSQKGGCQSLSEAALAQVFSRVLMEGMTIERKPTTLSSGELLKFSGTNPRHFHAVTIPLFLGNTDGIPLASLRQRGEQRDSHPAPVLHREMESEPTSSSKSCPQVPGKAGEHPSQEFPV